MSSARVRQVAAVHRLVIGCSCGSTLSLPSDGYSYEACRRCGLVYENTYRHGGGRQLAIHPPHIWKRRREHTNG